MINFKERKDIPKRIRELVGGKDVDVTIDYIGPRGLEVPHAGDGRIRNSERDAAIGLEDGTAWYYRSMQGLQMEPIGNDRAPVHLYWKEILEEFILSGAFDPTFVLTHRVPLEDMSALYKGFDE
ncbi:hypothetical protein H1R20_g1011, partial [Candolleomyces eurysporus]